MRFRFPANRYLCGVAISVLAASFGAVSASAQTETAPATADTAPQTEKAADSGASAADIIVTGSRIANGDSMPTPVTVVTAQDLLAMQPSSISQGLATLPGLLGSLGTTSNINQGGFNTINLRGVGMLRSLVLFDSHRVGPTQANSGSSSGAVNIDVIPQLLLQRVDVVTGGASAVYGSDAVSGVVNFVTDTKFEGIKINLTNGISTYGDDRKSNIGVAFGKKFAGGRGHFEASYEYRDNAGFERADRDFFWPSYTEQGSVVGGGSPGTRGNPFILTRDARLSTSTFGGLIVSGPLSGLRFTPSGTLTNFAHGTATGTSGVEVGGDGSYYVRATAAPYQRIHQGFARLDYELSDTINAHIEGTGTYLRQGYTQQNILLNRLAIGYNNPYLQSLQPAYAAVASAQLAAAAPGTNPSFLFSKMDTALPNNQIEVTQKYYMADAGLDGHLARTSSGTSTTTIRTRRSRLRTSTTSTTAGSMPR